MYQLNEAFYDRMGFRRPAKPTAIDAARRSQLMAYLMGEVLEFGRAVELIDQVDAATDLLYFVMDVFVELGVRPDIPYQIVHDANMAKLWPDGKPRLDHSVVPPRMLRPDGWERPEAIIAVELGKMLQDDSNSQAHNQNGRN